MIVLKTFSFHILITNLMKIIIEIIENNRFDLNQTKDFLFFLLRLFKCNEKNVFVEKKK